MLKVTTWNVNGIRARRQELREWLALERPDVVCLQEVKATPDKIPEDLCALPGYWCYWHGVKGYSGVALHFSIATFPTQPRYGHPAFDHEARIVTGEVAALTFASIYVPNGGKDFQAKVRFLDALDDWARAEAEAGRELVLCGDLNVAREPRDVHPLLQNPDQIGQTAEERAQLERVISRRLVDLSRRFHPDDDRLFTWWAPWRNMRERNIGWRLDYVLANQRIAALAKSCGVSRQFGTSDHGPVTATFDLDLPRGEAEPVEPQSPAKGQLTLF
jgi:exodeoxyribonuclease-3